MYVLWLLKFCLKYFFYFYLNGIFDSTIVGKLSCKIKKLKTLKKWTLKNSLFFDERSIFEFTKPRLVVL